MNGIQKTLKVGDQLRGVSYSYQIERVLGAGTFGITYKAYAVTQGQKELSGELGSFHAEVTMRATVAIKEFFMRDYNTRNPNTGEVNRVDENSVIANYRRRFHTEAKNLSSLNHPNIIKVMEVFEANGTVYMVMPFIDGSNLDQYVEEHTALEESQVLEYATLLSSALDYMHGRGMLHLDIKPENVMVTKNGKPILVDFGLSQTYNQAGSADRSTKITAVTPGYSPNEQMNQRNFTPTLDIYALAATMYKMLTGVKPPMACTLIEEEDYVDFYNLLRATGTSEQTIKALRKAMSFYPQDRPQTIELFLKSLGRKLPPLMEARTEKLEDLASVGETISSLMQEEEEEQTPSIWARLHLSIWLPLLLGLISFVIVLLVVRGCKPESEPDAAVPEIPAAYSVKDSLVELEYNNQQIAYIYTGIVDAQTKLPNGEGKAQLKGTEYTYEGVFAQGLLPTEGVIKMGDDGVFEGKIKALHADSGKYTAKNGMYFIGEFDNQGQPKRSGQWYNADGSKIKAHSR